ncbi:AtpZ/AtpI family protein [Pedobacter duraquae]|uniref:Putative F0F1-ATPase subunit (Ca2+/Mg2+ transporter) n=1 Tax=Pedobacter duraquae TaxID=425511 RepID=A0A4R6II36_9SPHI|nr:AtpZ/AtpI family protein [Pedobacter duraquae]TDO21597.1 putative F0F1-ATPase subunit (Ca2+/Mg2+ transporter) [Pedobacter duraquae]
MELNNNPKNRREVNNYVKYSGMFFQMLFVIGIFCFAGYKIDQYRGSHQAWFTAGLSLVGVVIAIYQILREVNKS